MRVAAGTLTLLLCLATRTASAAPPSPPSRSQPTPVAVHGATASPPSPARPATSSAAAQPPSPRPAAAALRFLRGAAWQAGGLAVGLGERALGRFAPDAGGPYKVVEVARSPSAPARSVAVFRSDQARTADDVATFVNIAKQHGVTDRSQILFVNLRAEKNEDKTVIAQYEARKDAALPGTGHIKELNLPILDNAPPAFYLGNVGYARAVDKVRQVYTALKDPSTKVAVIHCEEGKGRTGEIVATAVRVAMDGMSAEQAIAEAEQHGLSMPWQRAFIERFANDYRAGRIHF